MAGTDPAPAIVVDRLTKRYGDWVAVADLSFTVGRGEVFALLGPNGAGKTTAIEILEGYRGRDGGEARVLGLDPGRDAAASAARIGRDAPGVRRLPAGPAPRDLGLLRPLLPEPRRARSPD